MSLTAEQIASVCHEAHRELQRQLGEPAGLSWERTDPELQAPVIMDVEQILAGEVIVPREQTPKDELLFVIANTLAVV